MPYFSLEMCRALSSFAPELGNHYGWYGNYDEADNLVGKPFIECAERAKMDGPREWSAPVVRKICTAWQLDDVFGNLQKIIFKAEGFPTEMSRKDAVKFKERLLRVTFDIAQEFTMAPRADAYERVEKYLWSIIRK